MPVEPIVEPRVTRAAVINNAERLADMLTVTVADIARASEPHKNTVVSKLRGERGQYIIINKIITGANVLSENALNRSSWVLPIDDVSGEVFADPAFDDCLVFPRLKSYLQESEISERALGDLADVPTLLVKRVTAGFPFAKNIVTALFETLNEERQKRLLTELDINLELFN